MSLADSANTAKKKILNPAQFLTGRLNAETKVPHPSTPRSGPAVDKLSQVVEEGNHHLHREVTTMHKVSNNVTHSDVSQTGDSQTGDQPETEDSDIPVPTQIVDDDDLVE